MDQELPLTSPRTFPTRRDLTRLRQKLTAAQGNLDTFGTDERWFWHSYDYAWRRATIGDSRTISPIDPEGVWFNAELVGEAEAWYRAQNRSRPRDPAADIEAASARDAWARAHGCKSFREAKDVFGIQAVGRRMPGQALVPDEAKQLADVTIKDPALLKRARENVGMHGGDATEKVLTREEAAL